jgi:hypothetical protein
MGMVPSTNARTSPQPVDNVKLDVIPKGSETLAGGKRSVTTGTFAFGYLILKGSQHWEVVLLELQLCDPFRIDSRATTCPVVTLRLPPAIVSKPLRGDAQQCDTHATRAFVDRSRFSININACI